MIFKILTLITYYIASCYIGCYLNILAKANKLPVYFCVFGSFLFMFGWIFFLKTTPISLTKLTTLVNVVITFGYFIALASFGEKIIPIQWLGVLFLLIGIILINGTK